MTEDISIRSDLRAGDLGRVIELHGKAYDALPGFGLPFEAFVAQTIAEYVLNAGAKGRLWLAERGDELVGCTAVVLRNNSVGQLRWVLVDQSARGIGIGGRLVDAALTYARDQGCKNVVLETTDGLPESQALYEKLGFRITHHGSEELWDSVRPLIKMQLDLA